MTRWSTTTLGVGMLIAGAAMLVLPGPGIVTIGGGLAVLAREYPWARAALLRVRHSGDRLLGRTAPDPAR